jgi:hypothetical protein
MHVDVSCRAPRYSVKSIVRELTRAPLGRCSDALVPLSVCPETY